MNRHFEIISHKFNNLKQEIMKKYFLTMATVALFAIGFAASDEEESSSSESSTPQTEQTQESQEVQSEQKQESEAERQEREKQEKVKKVAEIAYQKGYEMRMSTRELINAESSAHMEYTMRYGKEPEEEQSQERWNVFLENYKKGFADAANKIMEKINSEDF